MKQTKAVLETRENIQSWLEENGYEIEQAISGYYRCIRHNEDGTTSLVYEDPACEDTYDYELAMVIAYDVICNQ